MKGVLRNLVIGAAVFLSAPQVLAQNELGLRTSVVVIDQERLLSETVFGLRLSGELEEATIALAEENRTIEQMLINEERALTEQRPSMSPEAFRDAADAFDQRVTEVRLSQDRKARVIAERRDAERRAFLDAALPILGGLMAQYGAFVILDRRQVFLSDDRVNVTDEAIALIDAALGERVTPQPRPNNPNETAPSGTETEEPAPEN